MSKTDKTIVKITADERDVLLGLVADDVTAAVHAIVTATQLPAEKKTLQIVKQLDWSFGLRAILQAVPNAGGIVWLSDFGRWYFQKLVDDADPQVWALEERTRLYQAQRTLKPKFAAELLQIHEDLLSPEPKEN